MATTVKAPEFGLAEYREPDPTSFLRRPKAHTIGHRVLQMRGFRICRIDSDELGFEPHQDVHLWPPVQVQVPRSPDYIARYMNMAPYSWPKTQPES